MTTREDARLRQRGVPVDFLERFCEAFGFRLKSVKVSRTTKKSARRRKL